MNFGASLTGEDPSPWGSPTTSPPRARPVAQDAATTTKASSTDTTPGRLRDSSPYDNPFASPATDSPATFRPPTYSEQHHEQGLPQQGQSSSTNEDRTDMPPVTPVKSPAQQQNATPHQTQHQQQQQPQQRLQVKITGLERAGKKDPILRFDVYYRDVRRLHSEFVKLSEHLVSANPEAIVPVVPPALSSAGAGTEEDEGRVKALMQRWFHYVCSSEVLKADPEMVLFVESDFGYSPMVKLKQPATGVRRKILKQFAPPEDETELQPARPLVKLFYLHTLDASHKIDKLVRARRQLGLAESEFGSKLGAMSVQEPHAGLGNAYRKLGKIVQTVGDYHAAQATAEATTLGDPFQYHSQDAFVVKETLTNRQILMREFQQAQETTRTRFNAADRLRSSTSVRPDKVTEAIESLNEARELETQLHEKTARVTENLVQDHRVWVQRTAHDLRLSIREFVLREIEAERRTLALLESVRPDVRAIDGSGGLSRLGREAHPPAAVAAASRRSHVTASQGPKGDAWSGIPRRSEASRQLSSSLFVGGGGGVASVGVSGSSGTESGRGDGSGLEGSGVVVTGSEAGLLAEDDGDRLDARNAASRLAASTF